MSGRRIGDPAALFLRETNMGAWNSSKLERLGNIIRLAVLGAGVFACSTLPVASASDILLSRAAGQATQAQLVKPVGAVKAINSNTLTLTTDSGSEIQVVVQDSTRIVRTMPGQKDLSKATALQLQGIEVGDRVLARGNLSSDGKSVEAISLIVMKKADLDAMKQREREDWTKRGIGGIVSAVDTASGIVTISVSSFGGTKNVAIRTTKDTIVRRYAPDSVKFDDAKISTLDQIRPGDQLRARGTQTEDGSELAAEEIVSGTFLNIAGPITALDTAGSTLTVSDLISKSPVTIKISSDSQIRQIPPAMAQMIAMRFKGGAAGAQTGASAAGGQRPAGAGASQTAGGAAAGAGGTGFGPGAGAPRSGGGDFQQVLSRLPAASLSDLKKGDVVMIVTTQKDPSGKATAITLLSGVDAILTASPSASQAMLLAPWNLSAPSGETMGP